MSGVGEESAEYYYTKGIGTGLAIAVEICEDSPTVEAALERLRGKICKIK